MSFERWLRALRELAELSGALYALEYDAAPVEGVLINMDGYAEAESRLPWMSLSDWGWKATVAAMSDIVASGGKPVAVSYSVGVQSMAQAREVARGVGEAAAWAGAKVVKSDTNRGRESWIDVAVLGYAVEPIGRTGARPGDLLLQVGRIGYGLIAELALRGEIKIEEFPEAMRYTRRPEIPLHIGPRLAECGARAAIDNSDGWIATLYQLAEASGVKIVVESILLSGEAESLGLPEERLMESWEDYNLAVAAPPEGAECLLKRCSKLGLACAAVGRIEEGRGLYLRDRLLPPKGWFWVD